MQDTYTEREKKFINFRLIIIIIIYKKEEEEVEIWTKNFLQSNLSA
jgi:hypothetical protein